MSTPAWDKPEFNKLVRRQTALHDKVYKFVKYKKKKAGHGVGSWHKKKTALKKDVSEYNRIKKKLEEKYGY